MKKLVNTPESVLTDALAGIAAVHPLVTPLLDGAFGLSTAEQVWELVRTSGQFHASTPRADQ
jgi:hypothetical protein